MYLKRAKKDKKKDDGSPVRWHVDSDTKIDDCHAANDNGELAHAYATAELAILFGYRAWLYFTTHDFLNNLVTSSYVCLSMFSVGV